MLRGCTSTLVTLLTVTAVARSQTGYLPVKLSKTAATAVVAEIEKNRAEAQRSLQTSPTSYLAAVARTDFGGKKVLTVGSAPGNDVRLAGPDIAPQHLRVTVDGDRFQIQAVDPAARFTADGGATRELFVGPSAIQVGRYTLRLSHQHFPAIIVFDPQSPRLKAYKGLKYFPVDLAYRFELPLVPNPKAAPVVILSTMGHQRRGRHVGWFDFVIASRTYRLEATRLLEPGIGEEDISVFFRDATSGKETYPIGRYLDVGKLPNGHYVLDFNRAYNPACAYSPHYNCPIPPKSNTLPVAIRAGEQNSHYD